jgi:DNA replication protein DnaD
MSAFSYFKPANGLWKEAKIAKITKRVLDRVTDLPQKVRGEKHNMELLSLIANLVENSGIENSKKGDKLKIDKKCLLISIYNELFGNLSPADCELLSKNVEFLHDNHHIIKLASWKMAVLCVGDWFKHKVLN